MLKYFKLFMNFFWVFIWVAFIFGSIVPKIPEYNIFYEYNTIYKVIRYIVLFSAALCMLFGLLLSRPERNFELLKDRQTPASHLISSGNLILIVFIILAKLLFLLGDTREPPAQLHYIESWEEWEKRKGGEREPVTMTPAIIATETPLQRATVIPNITPIIETEQRIRIEATVTPNE